MPNSSKSSRILRMLSVASIVCMAAPVSEAGFLAMLRVVQSSGPRTGTPSYSIFQPADLPQIVTVEVCMGDTPIIGYWVDIDCANLSNDHVADLRLADVSCDVDADCDAAFGVPGSNCVDGQCAAIFLDTNRADYVFSPASCQMNGESADDSCAPSMGVGGTSAVACYRQGCSYVGHFALELPADAVGTFILELSEESTLTMVNFQTGQPWTVSIMDLINKQGAGMFPVTISIRARIPPTPIASAASQAGPASRSAGVEWIPQTPVVEPFAVRVSLDSLHHPDPPYSGGQAADFSAFEGQQRWLGPPVQYVESAANPATFWASTLQCTPHYMDWAAVGPIVIMGSEVVPSSTLSVRTFGMNCVNRESTCTNVSPPLEVPIGRWGDVQLPFSTPGGATQPDFADISSLVDKFKNLPGALSKARAKLQPAIPVMAGDVDFSDISMSVDAFKGRPYPFTIQGCP